MSRHYKEIKNGDGTDIIIDPEKYISIGKNGEDIMIGCNGKVISFDTFEKMVNAMDVAKSAYHRGYSVKDILVDKLSDAGLENLIVNSFEEAKENDRRKNIVLIDGDIYLTFKANIDCEEKVFGEFVSWSEDEFLEDSSVYQTAVSAAVELFSQSDDMLDKHIADNDLIETFTRYDDPEEEKEM